MRILVFFTLIFGLGSVLSAPCFARFSNNPGPNRIRRINTQRNTPGRVTRVRDAVQQGRWLGDGIPDPSLPIGPLGNRVGLATSRTPFSRINGLDSQTCLECHNVRSSAEFSTEYAIGGAGGISQNAFAHILFVDMIDETGNGFAHIDGRFINPPFTFGAGGVELLAKEMTADLQRIRSQLKTWRSTIKTRVPTKEKKACLIELWSNGAYHDGTLPNCLCQRQAVGAIQCVSRDESLSEQLVHHFNGTGQWRIGLTFLNGFVLREEPCTDPFARFCGQTEAAASSDPMSKRHLERPGYM